jgi:Zn-dependent protease
MNMQRSWLHQTGMELTRKQQFLTMLNLFAMLFPVFLIIFTWRGFVQALVARVMGDRTAQQEGFLTINPLAHIDIVGLTIVIAIFFIIGGLFYTVLPPAILLILLILLGVRWTIPVPIDETQFSNYRLGGILTSLSGSLANFVLAFLSIGLLKVCLIPSFPQYVLITLFQIFDTLIYTALFFGIMDLIPLPPFDGGRLLHYLLPYRLRFIVSWLEEYSLYIFLILFFVPVISDIFFGIIATLATIMKASMTRVFF